jgi:adenosylhomocysteine nucleosidase
LTGAAGIVAALAAEASRLGPIEVRPDGLGVLSNGNLVCVTGVGSAAARGAQALASAGVKSLVSWGFAGGLDPALRAGTVFLPSEVIGGGAAFSTARDWRERLSRALVALGPLVGGKLLTSPRPVDSVAAKAALFESTGAAAADMESGVIAAVARDHGLPFVAVRVIVDTARDRVPAAAWRATAQDGRLKAGSLIFAVLRRPLDVGALIRLAQRYRVAVRALDAAALAGFRTAPPPDPKR